MSDTEKVYAQVVKANMRVNMIGGATDGLYPFDLRLAFTVDITDRPGVRVGMLYNPALDEFQDDGKGFSLPSREPPPTVDALAELMMNFQYQYWLKELIE